MVTFGAVQGTRWAGRKALGAGVQLELLEGPEDSLRSSYKYMFQRLRDIRNGKQADLSLELLWSIIFTVQVQRVEKKCEFRRPPHIRVDLRKKK